LPNFAPVDKNLILKSVFVKLAKFFLQGLLFITPLVLTIYAIYWMFSFIDELLLGYVSELVGFRVPGLGILIIVLIITIIGFLGSSIVFYPIIRYFDRVISRMPFISIIYNAFKDFMSALVGKDKKFNEPVLVRLSKDSDLEKIGFVTEKDLKQLGIDKGRVAVYFPLSYTISGSLFIVPSANVRPIHASPAEVMKFVVSAGVTRIKDFPHEEQQPDL
jgi:uncharacterized membrane protein